MIPGSANPLLLRSAAATGYQIQRSLRFNSSDSAYLSRTPASAGNRKTWTWAAWVKRSRLGTANHHLLSVLNGASDARFQFNSNDKIEWTTWNGVGGRPGGLLVSTAVYRDVGAWYHIVLSFDTTQGTASDRIKLYINGVQVTAFDTANYPSQNVDWEINNAAAHQIGAYINTEYFNGLLADVFFIDGQALTPSSFTEVSATTGQLIPKQYTGSFGTNGFWLKFSDNSAATATTLGKDYSSNSNNWTPNNLSVTAGAGNDSLVDTPTSYGTDTGAGGEVRGNYATWTPLVQPYGGISLTNGNLENTGGGSVAVSTIGIPPSGKYYVEVSGTGCTGGVCPLPRTTQIEYNLGAGVTGVIGIAVNRDAGEVKLYKDNVLQSTTTFSSAGISADATLFIQSFSGSPYSAPAVLNAGQRPFAYTAPSGFKALCDTNLPAPVVAKPSTVMDVVLYTGNSTDNRAITGLGFSPDLVWFGPRSQSGQDKVICDSVRGVQKALFSNQTYVEANPALYGSVGSFDSAGFTIKKGTDATFGFHQVNLNSSTYAAWCWDAGSSTVTLNPGDPGAGSITSQVRANASAGFSVVTWTGNGVAGATVGHGLGTNVALYFCKNRSTASNWVVIGHALNSALGGPKYLQLNTTAAAGVASQGPGNSSTIELYNDSTNNTNGDTYVAYCFAPVAGYSAFGSYTGNGSADGPFVYTGFRPRWVMLKQSSGSGTGWQIHDTSRNTYNVMNNRLQPNNSDAESTYTTSDFLSNGFKLRDSDPSWNSNGATYIYAAFAENPFAYARAR